MKKQHISSHFPLIKHGKKAVKAELWNSHT